MDTHFTVSLEAVAIGGDNPTGDEGPDCGGGSEDHWEESAFPRSPGEPLNIRRTGRGTRTFRAANRVLQASSP